MLEKLFTYEFAEELADDNVPEWENIKDEITDVDEGVADYTSVFYNKELEKYIQVCYRWDEYHTVVDYISEVKPVLVNVTKFESVDKTGVNF